MKSLLLVLALLLPAAHLLAWSGPGHMTVAAIAYRDLNPRERQQITAILSHHEEYAKWQAEKPRSISTIDAGVVAVMGASTWPDAIKRTDSPWNHRHWHYIDYPANPPKFDKMPSPAPEDDIVFAINLCMKNLKDPATSERDRACWLSWLIHLVGDIHQPLHCCTLINADFPAPGGDRGGNLVLVRATWDRKEIPLHAMWDEALGTSAGFHEKQMRDYVNQAISLGSHFRRTGDAELNPEKWARESWQLAIDYAYLHGTLAYSKDAGSAPVLPRGYTKKLKSVSEAQVAVAGYRLAALMREVIKGR